MKQKNTSPKRRKTLSREIKLPGEGLGLIGAHLTLHYDRGSGAIPMHGHVAFSITLWRASSATPFASNAISDSTQFSPVIESEMRSASLRRNLRLRLRMDRSVHPNSALRMSAWGQNQTSSKIVSDVCFGAVSGRNTHGSRNSVRQCLLLSGERTSRRGAPNVSL